MRMIARRLGVYVVTAWVAVTVNFLLPRLMPGNPIQTMIGKLQSNVTPAEIRSIRLSFGGSLQSSLVHQYFTYLDQMLHGNLGVSITSSSPGEHHIEGRRALDRGSDRHLDPRELSHWHVCGRAARLDPWIAAGFADSHGDVLPGRAVFLPRHRDAAGLRQRPALVPGARFVQPQCDARRGRGRSWRV